MRNISLVAAAVAATLGAGVAQAAAPTLATVQAGITAATAKQFWMGGSSAAKGAMKAFVQGTICGGAANTTVFSSASPVSNPDFNAYACTAVAGPTAGALTVIYYRAEGGSFVGVYPVINNFPIKYLDLSAANTTCAGAPPTYNCPVAGTQLANGPDDSWGNGIVPTGVSGSGATGAPANHTIDLGISDAEPNLFVGADSPYAAPPPAGYVIGTFGPGQTAAALKAMQHTTAFQETYGIVVNTALGTTNLTKAAVTGILQGQYVDWSSVPAAGAATPGAPVLAASTPIFVCNREVGSGTRTAADVFFTGNHCVAGSSAIAEGAGGGISDNYATSNVLTCVNSNGTANGAASGAIAIGYVSVENASKIGAGTGAPNVTLVSLDGVAPTNYNSAIGTYQWMFEATANTNTASPNPIAAAESAFVIPALQNINTGPQSAQVNAIPNQPAANTPQIPLQQVGIIYTSDFTRGGGVGNSCNSLAEAN